MMIDGWNCVEMWPDQEWCTREARRDKVTVTADPSGLDLEEATTGYDGASGRSFVPANVIMWLMPAVR